MDAAEHLPVSFTRFVGTVGGMFFEHPDLTDEVRQTWWRAATSRFFFNIPRSHVEVAAAQAVAGGVVSMRDLPSPAGVAVISAGAGTRKRLVAWAVQGDGVSVIEVQVSAMHRMAAMFPADRRLPVTHELVQLPAARTAGSLLDAVVMVGATTVPGVIAGGVHVGARRVPTASELAYA